MNTPLKVPFLREQRQFPSENLKDLASQTDQAYIDIANKLNNRTIGLFAMHSVVPTGENWIMRGSSQVTQGLRQIYSFTAAGNVPHGINFQSISQFTKPSGSFTDGTNYYGAIYASNVAIAGAVSFYITPTNIVILSGAGAPAIKTGTIVLEWASQV